MALIFSSGGGRLGNQIINLIHLTALSYEYDIEIYKFSDLFIESENGSLIFKIQKNKINWKITNQCSNFKLFRFFQLKLSVRLIHLLFHILPFKRSYKIGYKTTLPKFLIGKNFYKNISLIQFVKEATKFSLVISGWGLRDWNLVLKHKKKVIENILKGFDQKLFNNVFFKNKYLLVHIRKTDFLKIKEFNSLNFSDEIWLKTILKICSINSLKYIVLFSDQKMNNAFISRLEEKGLNVILPEVNYGNKLRFIDLFINYVSKSSSVLCNCSTLALSISFLFHESVYLPSEKLDFQELPLNEAHFSYPSSLTWN